LLGWGTRAYEEGQGNTFPGPVARQSEFRLRRGREISRERASAGPSYGIPAFNYHGMLVAYAAFAGHCSFFPASGELLEEFAEELQGYACSKGTIRFALDKPLPARLVQRLVKARVRKNEAKALGHDKAKKAH
jgi:uncharacterized protein YdhG (YjbR/CyaY superfamily)